MSLYNRFEEATSSLLGLGLIITCFALWCYGISECWRLGEYFWAVVSFTMPPVGFVIGLYNLIF